MTTFTIPTAELWTAFEEVTLPKMNSVEDLSSIQQKSRNCENASVVNDIFRVCDKFNHVSSSASTDSLSSLASSRHSSQNNLSDTINVSNLIRACESVSIGNRNTSSCSLSSLDVHTPKQDSANSFVTNIPLLMDFFRAVEEFLQNNKDEFISSNDETEHEEALVTKFPKFC